MGLRPQAGRYDRGGSGSHNSRKGTSSAVDHWRWDACGVGPDIFDKTPEDGGAWHSALQAALVKESVADGRVYLRLVHWPPGLLAPVESGAPEFTSDNWHAVRISIDQDRGVSLYQDGALVARGKLTDDSRSGVVGGHPGLYAYNWHQFSPPLAGTLLVDGYQITCW
jgi:hypothetical protein